MTDKNQPMYIVQWHYVNVLRKKLNELFNQSNGQVLAPLTLMAKFAVTSECPRNLRISPNTSNVYKQDTLKGWMAPKGTDVTLLENNTV